MDFEKCDDAGMNRFRKQMLLVSLSSVEGAPDHLRASDSAEHLGLILGSQKHPDDLLKHFGSLTDLAQPGAQR